jgi:tripartite-type tricarboxylate transporter receptor subunit TctC
MKGKLLLLLAGALALPASAFAQNSVADFYKKNHTIRLVVSSDAGGGYDAYARLLARHIGKHIPGNPNIIVQNMPGAGGLAAANFLYNAAPKNGTVIGGLQREVPFIQILGQPGPKFVTAKFNWLGSLASEVTLCVSWNTSPVKTFADLKKTELIVGGSGPNDTEQVPAILNNLLDTKFKIITGYPSSTAITLAVERGEVNGICASYSSLSTRNANWFRDKKVNLLVQAALQKHPDLPNVPLAIDQTNDPDVKKLLELNDARLEVGRPFVIPPGVPADRVKALRAAFVATAKDPEFLADAKKQRHEIDLVSGDEMQSLLERISTTPQTLIARLADVQQYKGAKVTAKVEVPKHEGAVTEVAEGGKAMTVKLADGKTYKATISGSRTKVTIGGKKADRAALKVGATCAISSYKSGDEASAIDCK